MLRIALCDDEQEQLESTHRILDEYLKERRLAAKVQTFADGEALLREMPQSGAFDVYVLDIVMPVMNGIDLGLRIRERDRDGMIIYLTTSPDFALESYAARAFFYLLKPVDREKLFEVLDEAVSSQRARQTQNIAVKTRQGQMRLPLDDILYAELKGRIARYYLKNGECVDSLTLQTSFRDALQPLLKDPRFVLCGASFVLNLYHVKMVDKSGVQFSDGGKIGLPKAVYRTLRTAWLDFWLEGDAKND